MFGGKIKELRSSLGLNQVEFAKLLNVTKQSVSNWENGNILPSIDMLTKIATKFSVSTDYLLGLSCDRFLDVSDLTEKQICSIQNLINDLKEANKK